MTNTIKSFLKKIIPNFLIPILEKLYRIQFPRHPLQDLPTVDGFNYITLGATNCGWTFVDDGSLFGCTIISAGLGEDGTFDVEFASKYNAKVVIVDPTPRAKEHYDGIVSRLGKKVWNRIRKEDDSQ